MKQLYFIFLSILISFNLFAYIPNAIHTYENGNVLKVFINDEYESEMLFGLMSDDFPINYQRDYTIKYFQTSNESLEVLCLRVNIDHLTSRTSYQCALTFDFSKEGNVWIKKEGEAYLELFQINKKDNEFLFNGFQIPRNFDAVVEIKRFVTKDELFGFECVKDENFELDGIRMPYLCFFYIKSSAL
ncbi:MAG: hypothetical protein ABIA04_08850 [Pseudomonadota bacterium]